MEDQNRTKQAREKQSKKKKKKPIDAETHSFSRSKIP